MPIALIDIDEMQGCFVITDEANTLFSNRRARTYFEDYLGAKFESNRIIVPYEIEVRDELLTRIQNQLKKWGIEEQRTARLAAIFHAALDRQRQFVEFSEQARRIWNYEFDSSDFAFFVSTVRNRLTSRSLYDLQLLSAFHLAFSQNACNFSVPGAGKTSVVYAAYAYLSSLDFSNPKSVNKILVIGPLSSFRPWEDEFEKCFGRKPRSKRLSGGVSRNEREFHLCSTEPVECTPELLLMSYQTLASDVSDVLTYLRRDGNNVMVVLDEAHRIKNTDGGVWSSAALEIADYAKSRVILTGTPVPNGYEDIYNLFSFIWPHENVLKFHLFQLKDMSSTQRDPRVPALIRNASSFFVRVNKQQLKEKFGVPDPIENDPILVEMGAEQKAIYSFIENNYLGYFREHSNASSWESTLLKARMIRLMQAASNPSLLRSPIEERFSEEELASSVFVDDNEILSRIISYEDTEIPAKFVAIRQLVEQLLASGEKVVIWTVFVKSAHLLQDYLRGFDINSELLIGETPVEADESDSSVLNRETIIRKFHDMDSSFKVVIANPFAVAESISLHKACHNAVYFERTFNASNFVQSKDRIHRVGLQPEDRINYYYISSRGTIEETVHTRLIQKERRMIELVESQPIPLFEGGNEEGSEFADDINAIIEDYARRSGSNK